MVLDEVITPAKGPGEVSWTIDEKLYLNAEEKDQSIQKKKLTQKMGAVTETLETTSQMKGTRNLDTT